LSSFAESVAGEGGVPADSDLGKFLRQEEIKKWKTFSDDDLSFLYPDFPGLTVTAAEQHPPEGTRIYGGPVGTVNRRSSRFYTIGTKDFTWAVLMLQENPWFDEGICLCGAVSLRVFVPGSDGLRAYDLLESGCLKKMQVLGDGVRVQVFEWTHLPMSHESYLKLTESIALRRNASRRSPEEWLNLAKPHCGRKELMGFLKPGMTELDVVSLLGAPDSREGDTLIYKDADTEISWMTTSRIPLTAGRFRSLPKSWRTEAEIPPERGTLRWALKFVNGDPFDDKPLSKAASQDLNLLKEKCLQQLKDCAGADWNSWIQVANGLYEETGWEESSLGPLIASRFLDKDVVVNFATGLLEELDVSGTQELMAKRIRFTLDGAVSPEIMKDRYLHSSPYGDLHNLLCGLDAGEQRNDFIREALDHPHLAIQSSAYSWLDKLPDDERTLEAALKGLENEDEYIRRNSSEELAKRIGTPKNLPELHELLKSEKDEETRANLKTAIKRLSAAD